MISAKSAVAARIRSVLPLDSRPRRVLAAVNQGLRAGRTRFAEVKNAPGLPAGARPGLADYDAWLRQEQRRVVAQASGDVPTTTFAVVVSRTGDGSALASTIEALRAQTLGAPNVVEVVDGVPLAGLVERLEEDFLIFLRAGDVLRPEALATIAKHHRSDPSSDVIGFDSDIVSPRGARRSPLFRPEWSPEMLLGTNYLGRAFAIRRTAAARAQLEALDDRGIWRMLLTADLSARAVARVPEVLLGERDRSVRPATSGDAEMVAAVLQARGESARTEIEAGVVRVRFEPESWPSVSIVVPTRHSRGNLDRLLPSLEGTDYPSFDITIIDNGGQSDANDEWYRSYLERLPLKVLWWKEQPFNYSRVNNVAARSTTGDVIVMLNDDTEVVDKAWLREMVGVLLRDGVGTVGLRLIQGEGRVQHGGVVVGPGGTADNLFAGLRPGEDTIIGSTDWYRNSLAVTGACVAIRREDFEEVGGLDERFILCGSDVVLGLDMVLRGRRNAVIPFDLVRHYESITRGSAVPIEDFYASYWRYHPWLQNGDPYVSPNVSRLSAIPRFRSRRDPSPVRLALDGLGRTYTQVKQKGDISEEAVGLLAQADITRDQVEQVARDHAAVHGFAEVASVNWFIPDVDMPFFGGLNTAFRLAAKLARENGVRNRFVILAAPNEMFFRSALAAAFPELADAEIVFYDGTDESLGRLPEADAAVATLWLTAIHVAKAPGARRKFYLMQDYEPGFYPASTLYAMAEESYRLGLYAICNTVSMYQIYTEVYGGKAMYFAPAVDRALYNPVGRRRKARDEPVTIFVYARDHFRNCWELAYAALREIKRRHGDRVRIIAAGARYLPPTADFVDLGLLDYRATGALYREADIGLTLQISRHPSYLPLELMASGVPMVAPDSTWFEWLFEDGVNSLLAMRSLDDVVGRLDLLVRDEELRHRLSEGALATIEASHSDWDDALDGVFPFLCDPEGSDPNGATARRAVGDTAQVG